MHRRALQFVVHLAFPLTCFLPCCLSPCLLSFLPSLLSFLSFLPSFPPSSPLPLPNPLSSPLCPFLPSVSLISSSFPGSCLLPPQHRSPPIPQTLVQTLLYMVGLNVPISYMKLKRLQLGENKWLAQVHLTSVCLSLHLFPELHSKNNTVMGKLSWFLRVPPNALHVPPTHTSLLEIFWNCPLRDKLCLLN